MLRSIFCIGDCPWIVLTTSSFPGICQCFDMFWRPLLGTWTCNLEGMLLEIPHPTWSVWNDTQLDGLLDSSAGAYRIKYRSCVCVRTKTVTKLLADSRITMVGTIYIWAEMMFQKSSYSRNFISSWLQSRCSSTMHLLVVASVHYMNPVDLWPTNNHQCKVFPKNIGGILPKKGTAPRCFLFVHRSQFLLVQFQFVLAFSQCSNVCWWITNPY